METIIRSVVLCCSIVMMNTAINKRVMLEKQAGYELVREPYCKNVDSDGCEVYLTFYTVVD